MVMMKYSINACEDVIVTFTVSCDDGVASSGKKGYEMLTSMFLTNKYSLLTLQYEYYCEFHNIMRTPKFKCQHANYHLPTQLHLQLHYDENLPTSTNH